jgi:hypothetical protein
MGRKYKRRHGPKTQPGEERRLVPDPAEITVAWANLVGAIVLTMMEEDVDHHVIHGFLDYLDMANITALEGGMLAFVLHVTDDFRTMVPSND